MVRNCPCQSQKCVCYVEGEGGLSFDGNGTGRLPYRPAWVKQTLEAQDSDQANITITGAGTSGSPYVVSIATLGGAVIQTVYESDGTFVKPLAGSVAHVVVIGGGGGGGGMVNGGRVLGASGGSGGAMSSGWFLLQDLPTNVDIEVGGGGTRGRNISGQTNGGDGGASWFGEYLYAAGGRHGGATTQEFNLQFPTVGGTPPDGGPGGAGGVRNGNFPTDPPDQTLYPSPAGGGIGEGTTVGSLGGEILISHTWAGEGGDGGGGSLDGDGVAGEKYGGGGGGGASNVGSGADGAAGAQGVVVVTVW